MASLAIRALASIITLVGDPTIVVLVIVNLVAATHTPLIVVALLVSYLF